MILLSLTTIAQEKYGVLDEIESHIREKTLGWQLVKKRVHPQIGQAIYQWRKGKSSVAVHFFVYESEDVASTRFKSLPGLYQGSGLDVRGLDMIILRAKVPKLGDENYLWEESQDRRLFGVDFRKGKIVVHTAASSIATAEQFALQMAEAVP